MDLDVERDDERREYRLRIVMRDGQSFSSRVVSDGTLRVLSLLTILHDPQHRGVICFEEPENGVNKLRLEALMGFLEESCAQPADDEISSETQLLQIIVNTHSMVAARAVRKAIIMADMSRIVSPDGAPSRRCTRMTPYVLSEQLDLALDGSRHHQATIMEIEQFLEQSERSSLAA